MVHLIGCPVAGLAHRVQLEIPTAEAAPPFTAS
jgi:hypothetical protein